MGAAGVKRESATVVMDRCRKQIEKLADPEDRRAVLDYLSRKFPEVSPAQRPLTGLA